MNDMSNTAGLSEWPETIVTPRERRMRLLDEVAARHGTTIEDIRRPDRLRAMCAKRQAVWFDLHHNHGWTITQLALASDRDRTAIRMGIRNVAKGTGAA